MYIQVAEWLQAGASMQWVGSVFPGWACPRFMYCLGGSFVAVNRRAVNRVVQSVSLRLIYSLFLHHSLLLFHFIHPLFILPLCSDHCCFVCEIVIVLFLLPVSTNTIFSSSKVLISLLRTFYPDTSLNPAAVQYKSSSLFKPSKRTIFKSRNPSKNTLQCLSSRKVWLVQATSSSKPSA